MERRSNSCGEDDNGSRGQWYVMTARRPRERRPDPNTSNARAGNPACLTRSISQSRRFLALPGTDQRPRRSLPNRPASRSCRANPLRSRRLRQLSPQRDPTPLAKPLSITARKRAVLLPYLSTAGSLSLKQKPISYRFLISASPGNRRRRRRSPRR